VGPARAEARGADFVDVNLGCPIDHFTGREWARHWPVNPRASRRIVESMAKATTQSPNHRQDSSSAGTTCMRNHVDLARCSCRRRCAGSVSSMDALATPRYLPRRGLGRHRRESRLRSRAVVGNGDLLFPHEIEAARVQSGCAGVMVSRVAPDQALDIPARSPKAIATSHRHGSPDDLSTSMPPLALGALARR
jgi:hypothetical protein